jgi:hypothetical protein
MSADVAELQSAQVRKKALRMKVVQLLALSRFFMVVPVVYS